MLGSWSALLLFSAELFLPALATHDHVKFHHKHAAAAKRQTTSQDESKSRWEELQQQYLTNLRGSLEEGGQCTWDNMVVRREWGDMTDSARKDYLSAIQCLKELPTRENRDQYPGVRSRYDDFTIAHAINTGIVHRSPWLPVWHRQYVWAFETALREECGYQYGHPYWHWSKYLGSDPNSWPMFDNSETSISGNGTQTGEQCACVNDGPLKDWQATLGPSPNGWGCSRNPRDDGFGYNPRCIERTFNVDMLNNLKYSDVVQTVEAQDPNTFSRLLELEAPSIHNYPHIFMGGTQIEVTFSSQDPWFFFHHMMVEYIFDMWQSLDYGVRTTTLADSAIFDDIRAQGWSATPEVGLDSEVYLSEVFGNRTVREAMWPSRGGYCWRYE